MTEKAERDEKVRVSVPVEVNVRLTEDMIEEALRKSEMFWVKIKPRLDVGKLVESFVKDSREFYIDFYAAENLTLQDLIKLIQKHSNSSQPLDHILKKG